LNIEKENTMRSQAPSGIKGSKLLRVEKNDGKKKKTSSMEKIKKLFNRRKGWQWTEPDPDEVSIDNAYKTRWIWYHTILALELLMVNILLVGVIIVLAIKL